MVFSFTLTLAVLGLHGSYLIPVPSPEGVPDAVFVVGDKVEFAQFSHPCRSISASQAILQIDRAHIQILDFSISKETKTLEIPKLDSRLYFSWQRDFSGPFLQTANWVLRPEGEKIQVGTALEVSGPGSQLLGNYGMNVTLPQLVSIDHHLTLVVSGEEALLFDASGKMKSRIKLNSRTQLLPLDSHLLWINYPEEGDTRVSSYSQPLFMNRTITVPELNKYTRSVRTEGGWWLITFPISIKASLKAWDKNHMDLNLNWITATDEGLNIETQVFEQAPLNFHLGVSSGGSPKLVVEPGFECQPAVENGHILMVEPGNVWLLNAKGRVAINYSEVIGLHTGDNILFRSSPEMGSWDNQGHFHPASLLEGN